MEPQYHNYFFSREILYLQHFHNKFYVVSCYWQLLVGKIVISIIDLN